MDLVTLAIRIPTGMESSDFHFNVTHFLAISNVFKNFFLQSRRPISLDLEFYIFSWQSDSVSDTSKSAEFYLHATYCSYIHSFKVKGNIFCHLKCNYFASYHI